MAANGPPPNTSTSPLLPVTSPNVQWQCPFCNRIEDHYEPRCPGCGAPVRPPEVEDYKPGSITLNN